MTDEEVDLDNGFLIAPPAVPTAELPPVLIPTSPGSSPTPTGPGTVPPGIGPTPAGPKAAVRTTVRITFPATREQVFKSFSAIANLADKSDGAKIKSL